MTKKEQEVLDALLVKIQAAASDQAVQYATAYHQILLAALLRAQMPRAKK